MAERGMHMDERRCFIKDGSCKSRLEIIEYLEERGYTIDAQETRSREEIIDYFLPIGVDKISRTYWMMGNVTCAAPASASGMLINKETFFEWMNR